jgi:RNA polymerase sigma-70 factor (ECF subfamily)
VIRSEEVRKAAQGNLEAIEHICLTTWKPLYGYIYAKVQNREEAEDITQETYYKTLLYLREHQAWPENLPAFMKTVALNIVRDRWRQNKRHGQEISFEEQNSGGEFLMDQQTAITQRLQLEKAMTQLAREQRKIIDLRIIKGYSVAETARLLQKSEAAVRTAQYRALQALALILKKDDQIGSDKS